MSQQPINKRHPQASRDAIWRAILDYGKRGESFTSRDIKMATRCSIDQVRTYLMGLTTAGYLERVPGSNIAVPATYRLIKNTGIEAPRITGDGRINHQGDAKQQMWQTMPLLKQGFSPKDLAIMAATDDTPVREISARRYCQALCGVGYLAVLAASGERYILLPTKWTGPRAPMIQKNKQVYDLNLGKVVAK